MYIQHYILHLGTFSPVDAVIAKKNPVFCGLKINLDFGLKFPWLTKKEVQRYNLIMLANEKS